MAGLPNVFQDAMQLLVDNPPPSEAQSIQDHADAFVDLLGTLTNPLPNPGALSAARAAFVGVAQGQSLPPPVGILAVQAAYVAAVTALIGAAAPFTGTPPAGPPPIATATSLPSYVVVVTTWLGSGTASVPPAPPSPWA